MDALNTSIGKIAGRLFVILSALTSFNCFDQPVEPVAPSWDVNFTIPLANRSYSLSEIVQKDTSILHVGSGGEIVYASTVPLPPTIVGDVISLAPPDTTLQVKFGIFSVTTPPLSLPVDIPWLPHGVSVPIPDTSFGLPPVGETINTFQSVTFESGTLQLTMQNNLPVPIDLTTPIDVFDAQQRVVATFVFTPPTIPPNSTRSATDDLANKTVGNDLQITGMNFHTSGSAIPVQIPNGSALLGTLTSSNLKARQAVFAQIPAQRLANNDTTHISLDDSTLVKEVLFRQGALNLAFTSRVNLDMLLKFRLSELYRSIGGTLIPYEDSIYLPAMGTGNYTLNLAGRRIQSLNGSLIRSLEVISSVILPSGSGIPVTVNDTDKVAISLTTGAAPVIDTAVAVLKPTWLNVNVPIAMDFGGLPTRFSGQLNIPLASLGLSTNVSFGFPTDLYVSVAARRNTGEWVYLQVPSSQKRIVPGPNAVVFDGTEVGQFLSQFSGEIPDTLYIMGSVLVNPPEVYDPTLAGTGGISYNSAFAGMIDLQVPMMLGISNGMYSDTLALGDTTGDGNADFIVNKSRLREVNSGKLYIQVQNALPLQVGISLGFMNHVKQNLLQLPQSGQPVMMAAAQVDANGNVTLPALSTSTIELNASEVRQFDPTEFLSYTVSLVTTPGTEAVRFRTTDFVRIRMWSTLSYRMN